MAKPHVECFKGCLLLWNPMLKLHGDISHKKTCVCILINDRFIVRRSPNKFCTAGHIVSAVIAGPAPCLCIVYSVKLRLLVPQYSGWYMDFTWTDKHCGAVIWTRNQRDLQLLFMFMQISYVIWYALDIIRIVYVFKLACTLIIH